ncbi:MAG: hypothetical protein J5819_02905 [Eubacterium sp.]|nr:hypothetical protein [Eubacterium sp.]
MSVIMRLGDFFPKKGAISRILKQRSGYRPKLRAKRSSEEYGIGNRTE